MHSLRGRLLFKIDRSIQHRYVPSLQRWHLLGGRILFLLCGVRSGHILKWDGVCTLLVRHLFRCSWCVGKRHVQLLLRGLLLFVVVATVFLRKVR